MKVKVVNSNGLIEETLAPFNNDLRWAKGIKIYEKNKMLLTWNKEQITFFSFERDFMTGQRSFLLTH